ncbi:MAG: hypothetical protein KAS32_19755 [Candidatus Peribacteraceae bacterium]|nr:hypothetical protein [Candidatus Peribacteraceae bacterium]
MILETHLGIVMVNDSDVDREYGIEVRVDSLLPDETYPVIAKPLFKSNRIQIPKVGQQVEVVVIADEVDPDADFGDLELGTVDFADFIFYKNRIFDQEEGKIPPILKDKSYYPFLSGWWLDDDTIIYMSNKKNFEGIVIQLVDDTTQIRITTSAITIKRGSNILEISDTGIKIGSTSASEALMLGTIVKAAFTTLFTTWNTQLGTLSGATDAVVVNYGSAMVSAVGVIQGTLSNWLSNKHTTE